MNAARSVAIVALAVAFIAGPSLAVDGRVLDDDGKQIEGARVCTIRGGVELLCRGMDAKGRFHLPDSDTNDLRVVAPGYMPVTREARGRELVIVLKKAPTLMARLIDSKTGEPISEGEVWVVYPSAKRKGPFPANRAGVRVKRVLEPGDVEIVGNADGYDEASVSATLEAGKEADVELKLEPSGS